MNQATAHADAEQPTTATAEVRRAPVETVEAVHVRNYDHRGGHSVRVTAAIDDDDRLAERHYLGPGQSVRVTGPLPPGEYDLRVWVDGVERERSVCRLDDTPDGTAVVELGNGVVSLTTGATGLSAPG